MSRNSEWAERIKTLSSRLDPIPTGVEPRLAPLPDVRCVLFDIYGTLVISGSGDVGTAGATGPQQAVDAALAAAGIEAAITASTITDIIKTHHTKAKAGGVPFPEVDITEVWAECLKHAGVDSLSRDRLQRVAVEYEARINPVWPMPGMQDTLDALNARNLKLGLVSNAQFYTPLLFRAFTGRTHADLGFDELICVWSYRHREAKPSKDLFRRALAVLDEWGIQPDGVVYVGNDMRNDIWPASELGCRTALFAGDKRSLRLREDDPNCRDLEPDIILTALPQVLDCLP